MALKPMFRPKQARWIGAIGATLLTFYPSPTLAQIAGDGTVGTQVNGAAIVPCTGVCTIDGGTVRGVNLFHSFERFSVPTGGEAYFNNGAPIQNILTRVTGSLGSTIDGLLRTNGTANLYFLNPNGITFGPNARLQIGGSFVSTTASSFKFPDGSEFSAVNPQAPPLLVLNLTPGLQFGQNQGRPNAPITISGSELLAGVGQDILLLGGSIDVNNSFLYGRIAEGSRVELGAIAGTGTIGVEASSNELHFQIPENIVRGDISIRNSTVDVSTTDGGSIGITARNLELLNSTLLAGIYENRGRVGSQAGDITITATGTMTLNRSDIKNEVGTGATGSAGNILINAGSLFTRNGFIISTLTLGQGNGGNVLINARDTIDLVGADGSFNFIRGVVSRTASGNSGNVQITTGTLALSNGATLNTNTFGRGNAGNITINARDRVLVDGQLNPDGSGSSIFSSSMQSSIGQAGNIQISTGTLELVNGALLNASSAGQGSPGNVIVNARDRTFIDGQDQNGVSSGIFNTLFGTGLEQPGDIQISTGSLALTNGARISASNVGGRGDAGNIVIQATGLVEVQGRESAISNRVEQGGIGSGGDITLSANSLFLLDGGQILTSVQGTEQFSIASRGNSGNITLTVQNETILNGIASQISSGTGSNVDGNSGKINISTGSLSLINRGIIQSAASGNGDSGTISITAKDNLNIVNNGSISSSAGGSGEGGDINITASSLSLLDSFGLSTITTGKGDAGNVFLLVRDSIRLNNSFILAGTLPSATGNSGNITIFTGSLSLTGQGSTFITTISGGQGNAGNIQITARDFISLLGRRANITSQSSFGNGGDIDINARTLSLNDGALLSSSSTREGAAGDINVSAPSVRLNNQSNILAISDSGQGGNINLNNINLLLLRRGSAISATAGFNSTGGNGGNITINAPRGFLVSAPNENNDISADAFRGSGGRVTINAQGIYYFVPRSRTELEQLLGGPPLDPRRLPTNDITAISQENPNLSGVVTLNTPNIDPSQGLIELPTNLIDPTNQIDQRCTSNETTNSFTSTGRGGIPLNPGEPLESRAVVTKWVALPEEGRGRGGEGEERGDREVERKEIQTSSIPAPIVEAQGWVVKADGAIELVANQATGDRFNVLTASVPCQTAQGH